MLLIDNGQDVFTPMIEIVGKTNGIRDFKDIESEPMLLAGDYLFTVKNAGPLTIHILQVLTSTSQYESAMAKARAAHLNCVVDTRITKTMPGDFPAREGWHCDDHDQSSQDIIHFQCNLATNSSVSNTEFFKIPSSIVVDKSDVWNSVDKFVNRIVKNKPEFVMALQPGQLIMFNHSTIHRAAQTKQAGWRLFFRLSFTTRKPMNSIRSQVQIYTQAENYAIHS
jgi:ectoine hydroxylase-related dioxygenase (phytanoyl-CoA dioxygenase family)